MVEMKDLHSVLSFTDVVINMNGTMQKLAHALTPADHDPHPGKPAQ